MRILQLSDTHLGARINARGPTGWSRADDHHAALRAALQPALAGEVDLVVHAGDVFDRSRPPRRDVERAAELLAEVAAVVPVCGIAGNHDRRGIRRWLPNRRIGFVDQPTRLDVQGLALGLLPFRRHPDSWVRDAARLGEVDLLVCHQGFVGSACPGLVFDEGGPRDTLAGRHLPAGVRWIASGHLHPRQSLCLGGATIVHGGSTERTSFSEADETKGTVVWDFSSSPPTWVFRDHETRPMRTVARACPGALVRCTEGEVQSVVSRGAIAVVRAAGRTRPRSPPTGQLGLF